MADNATLPDFSLAAYKVAADEIAYSGDTTKLQLMRLVHVSGAEGSKTLTEICDTTGVNTHPQPATTGGCAMYHVVAGASTNTANIKASPGQLYGVHVFNAAAYPVHVKFHNTSGTPTAGVAIVRTVTCQAGQRADVAFPLGLAFSTGIGVSIVKLLADSDTTVLVAGDCILDAEYK